MSEQQMLERIVSNPNVLMDKPVIKGTRLTVKFILLRLEDERSVAKIETLRRLLDNYAERLSGQFVVTTETKVRFARA